MIVGIIDSGIDTKNPSLMGRVVGGFSLYLGKRSSDFTDSHGHGTLTASTILRYAPNTKFIITRALNEELAGSSQDVIHSIELLADMGAQIIHASLATDNIAYLQQYEELCNLLGQMRIDNHRKNQPGPYLVASRHNDANINQSLPAMLPLCFGVDGSVMLSEDEFWYNPTYQYQIVTSRTPILTTGLDGVNEFYGGTSKAAAIATGILAATLTETEGNHQMMQQLLQKRSSRQEWKLPLHKNFSPEKIAQTQQRIQQKIAFHREQAITQKEQE